MANTNCLTASMLAVGMRHQTSVSFTHDQVAAYCEVSRDYNAIHHDPEAAKLRFPGVRDVIVPGSLIQAAITGIFGTEFPGDGCLGLTFVPERIRKPVCPGDELSVEIEVTKLRGPIMEVAIRIDDGAGERLLNATARLMAADEAYRAWWEESRHPSGGEEA